MILSWYHALTQTLLFGVACHLTWQLHTGTESCSGSCQDTYTNAFYLLALVLYISCLRLLGVCCELPSELWLLIIVSIPNLSQPELYLQFFPNYFYIAIYSVVSMHHLWECVNVSQSHPSAQSIGSELYIFLNFIQSTAHVRINQLRDSYTSDHIFHVVLINIVAIIVPDFILKTNTNECSKV